MTIIVTYKGSRSDGSFHTYICKQKGPLADSHVESVASPMPLLTLDELGNKMPDQGIEHRVFVYVTNC